MRSLNSNPNIDNSDPFNYPDGRIKDNTGTGNGTPVNEKTKGDWHQAVAKLMRLYEIIPNGLPDNTTNGYQIIDALSALASKNDYIYPLTTNGTTTLNVDIKLSLMKTNEFLICLASANKTTETLIKGSGTASFVVVYSGNFKANEYVRLIKTDAGVSIIRVADWNSLNSMVTELEFLKKASYAQEIAGISDTVATNPLSNVLAFVERVNGAASSMSLATAIRNGLYPKEHFAIVAGIGANKVRNIGWFSGLEIGGGSVGQTYARNGDVVSATLQNNSDAGSTVRIVLNNTMTDNSYYVRTYIEGLSLNMDNDDDIGTPVFKPVNATTFDVRIGEYRGTNQNLKVHFEVVKI